MFSSPWNFCLLSVIIHVLSTDRNYIFSLSEVNAWTRIGAFPDGTDIQNEHLCLSVKGKWQTTLTITLNRYISSYHLKNEPQEVASEMHASHVLTSAIKGSRHGTE